MRLAKRPTIRRRSILIAGVPVLLALGLFLLVDWTPRSNQVARLPDGSRLTVHGVTAGTRHVFYEKPRQRLYPLLQAIPGLPERVLDTVRPWGCDENSPSLVLWCTWHHTWSTSSPPELVLVDETGIQSEPLELSSTLQEHLEMMAKLPHPTPGAQFKGMFASSKLRPKEQVLRIRIYHQDQNQNRSCAGELSLRNPSYTP